MDCDRQSTNPNGDPQGPIEGEEQNRQSSALLKNNAESITIKEEEEEETEIISKIFSKLPAKYEIILEIFSYLPPKTVFKFKCISKSLSELTRQVDYTAKHSLNCRAIAGTSFTGLFYQRASRPDDRVMLMDFDEIEFLLVESEAGCLPDPSLKFLKQKGEKDVVTLINSCNGLLLCSNTNSIGSVTTCFVCNPLTREKVALPHPRMRSNRVYYALLADLTGGGYPQYKVVCLFRAKGRDADTELLMLSAETGQWEKLEKRLPELQHETMMGSKVFFNGSLFWDCFDGRILVCHLNAKKSQRSYELIEAPRAPLGRCLWKFEDNLLCYCHGFPDEFPVWSLHTNDKKELEWKIEGCEEFENLTEDISRMYSETFLIRNKVMVAPRVRFKIIVYKPESNMMLLWCQDSIFSYQRKDRRLELVAGGSSWRWLTASCAWRFHSKSCAVPYMHSLVPIQIGKGAEEAKEREIEEKDKKSRREKRKGNRRRI